MATKLPQKIAVSYYKDMLKLIKAMEATMTFNYNRKIAPLIYEFEALKAKELTTNADSLTNSITYLKRQYSQSIQAELSTTFIRINKYFTSSRLKDMATAFVGNVNIKGKTNISSAIAKSIKSSVPKSGLKDRVSAINVIADKGIKTLAKAAIAENVALITTIPERYFERIEKNVLSGFEEGRSVASIADDIMDIGGIEERRARFIARDQLGSVYGDLTKCRQENLGLKRFRWSSSGDGRVREEHEQNNGNVFDWDSGDDEGDVPGSAYNCRCTAEAVEEDILSIFDGTDSF